jgi:hypothetical protein
MMDLTNNNDDNQNEDDNHEPSYTAIKEIKEELDDRENMMPMLFLPDMAPGANSAFRLSGKSVSSSIVITGKDVQTQGDKFATKGILICKSVEEAKGKFKYSIGVSSTTQLIPIEYMSNDDFDSEIKFEVTSSSLLYMAPKLYHTSTEQLQLQGATHVADHGFCYPVRDLPPYTPVVLSVCCTTGPGKDELFEVMDWASGVYQKRLAHIERHEAEFGFDGFGNKKRLLSDMATLAEASRMINSLSSLEDCLNIQGGEDSAVLFVLQSFCGFLLNDDEEFRPEYVNGDCISFDHVPQPWDLLLFQSPKLRFVDRMSLSVVCQFMDDKFPRYLNLMNTNGFFYISDSLEETFGPDGQYMAIPRVATEVLTINYTHHHHIF